MTRPVSQSQSNRRALEAADPASFPNARPAPAKPKRPQVRLRVPARTIRRG